MDYWLTPYTSDPVVILGCLGVYAVLGATLLRAACAFFNGTSRSEPPPDAPPEEIPAAPAERVALEEPAPSQGIQRREVGVKEVVPALPDEPEPPSFLIPVAAATTGSGEVPIPSFLRALGIATVALVVVIVGHDVMDAFDLLAYRIRGMRGRYWPRPPFEREMAFAFLLFAFFATAGVVAGLLPTRFPRACLVVFIGGLFLVPIALVVGLGVNVLLGPAP